MMNQTPLMLEQAEKYYSRLLEISQGYDERTELFKAKESELKEIFGLSDFIGTSSCQCPDILQKILVEGHINQPERNTTYEQELKAILAKCTDDNMLKRALRRFRREKMMAIAWRELIGLSNITESFTHLSELAEIIIVYTLDYLYKQACALNGTPIGNQSQKPQKMLVIGMGKLGGRELNFSSDIDLIFCYPERGETVGARRSLDNQVFFTRLGQQLIQALDQKTSDGQVFRVDMRLRPFGDSGPLVSSFASLEDYYLKHGRSWERYAMVKGRILGEQTEEANELQEMLRPFVFRRYLDFSAVESLRKMKSMIEAEVRRRQLHDNFKLGQGGIREIEFIAQVFQLMRGGRMKALQERHLLSVLLHLMTSGCIEQEAYNKLVKCYIFLRRTENALQEINDEQSQTLPSRIIDQERLALAMGFDNFDEFYNELYNVMSEVHKEFALIIRDEDSDEEEAEPIFSDLWLLSLNEQEIEQIVIKTFADQSEIKNISQSIKLFKEECANKPIGPKGREILNKLMPNLFSKIANMSTYSYATFTRIAKLMLSIVQRTTYLQLMHENESVCEHLVKLCMGSELIAQQLSEHPVLLDELIMPKHLYTPTDPHNYLAELREFLLRVESDDLEQQMESLRQFKQIQLLRICASDLVGALPLMKVSDYLTYLAQAILSEVVNLTWNQLVAKHGLPSNARKYGDKGVCVVAYGKLGGLELGYRSDLDLVFLCDCDLDGETDGDNKISDKMFYGRFAQRLMHLFSTRLSSGILYEVDARLRPEGDAGPLICSIGAYDYYLNEKAWTWELQALVRARAVLGPERLKDQFNEIRERTIRRVREEDTLRKEVVSMRDKMRESLIKGKSNEFDLKQGIGGMTDIEFIAQFLMLNNASKHADMVLWSDNVRIFEECARLGVIDADSAKNLTQAYLDIRNRYHKQALQGLSRVISGDELLEQRKIVTEIWQRVMIK